MKTFFIASSWEDRKIANSLSKKFILDFGWRCNTTWWFHVNEGKGLHYALEDMDNVKKADLLIVYNSGKKTTGKLIEIGMALALDKRVFIYGKPITGVYSNLVKYMGELD